MEQTQTVETLTDVVAGKAAVCPRCHKSFKDRANAEAVESLGMCLGCDHVEGEEKV